MAGSSEPMAAAIRSDFVKARHTSDTKTQISVTRTSGRNASRRGCWRTAKRRATILGTIDAEYPMRCSRKLSRMDMLYARTEIKTLVTP